MTTFAKKSAHNECFLLNNSYLCAVKPEKGMTDILKKRLALFHPLNLDNSLSIGIDRNTLPLRDICVCI